MIFIQNLPLLGVADPKFLILTDITEMFKNSFSHENSKEEDVTSYP